ncbi:3-methyladenine DNA glycosylase [Micrococcoides hystricis]|uniref:3-methyladenine DNA glycosylase n=1 Tax=Micrococcoides hystricis TaxID=1572761 RepID=A0ABV6PAQ4_9MICC
MAVYTEEEAREAARAHRARVRPFTEPFLERRATGRSHPVEDFLFTYYSHRPAALQRWHPGLGNSIAVGGTEQIEQETWKYYRREHGQVSVDLAAFMDRQLTNARFHYQLLANTLDATPRFGCFGLHEWAMAYRAEKHGIRHSTVPLRLGSSGTNEVVESHTIACTHYDAFRFFAPEAVSLNTLQPSRQSQLKLEQPACLHANMDLYRVAYKLTPLFSSELVMDCFELAWDIRTMDMQASPYDLADWGYEPVKIETPEGKRTYARAQREFSARAQLLRKKLLQTLDLIPADLRTDFSAASS